MGLKEYYKSSPREYGTAVSFISLVIQYFETLFSAKIKSLKLPNAIRIQTSPFNKTGTNFIETLFMELRQ